MAEIHFAGDAAAQRGFGDADVFGPRERLDDLLVIFRLRRKIRRPPAARRRARRVPRRVWRQNPRAPSELFRDAADPVPNSSPRSSRRATGRRRNSTVRPTQKPSRWPAFRLATICGGGTTTMRTSRSGSMPCAANQRRSRCRCDENGDTTPNVKIFSRRERMISSRNVLPSRTPRCHKSLESVMALPLRFSTSAVRQSQGIEPRPSVAATGMAASACAASSSRWMILSRMVAQPSSRLNSTRRPNFLKQSQFLRHHQRRAVGQRHETEPQRAARGD